MTSYMLDTNTVSHLLRAHPIVTKRIIAQPMHLLCISAITKGELLFGLAKRPDAKRLHKAVGEFLKRVDVLPWDTSIAEHYGPLRASITAQGKSLAALDLLIAAHAQSIDAILVSSDRAFTHIADLHVEDWTA